ncbi:MAG: 7-cyano-7-deazaguanine synthase QueC [Cryobacterium sp.]|nr:7-cyano-7-deazaguanine synthase QueC [Oligoflexia bacterium]
MSREIHPTEKSKSAGRPSSVILLSGGLDSAANLALGVESGDVLLALHVDYGQRAEVPEWRASQKLADYYGVKIEKISIPWLGALGGSSLTDRSKTIPELKWSELDTLPKIQESAKSVWVPNRNGVLVNLAASFAERLRADQVLVGFNREEATTFPDNSEEFLDQCTQALRYSTANGVAVFSYTTRFDKIQICDALKNLSRPFPHALVWSCYLAGDEPCGKCESCGRHDRALKGAGVE